MRFFSSAVFLIVAIAAPAAAQVSTFYTVNDSGNIHRWNPGSPPVPTLVAQAPVSQPEGIALAPDGMIYMCGWTPTTFRRIDPASGQVTNLPIIQPLSVQSFFKDLAWDPATNRLIGLHFGAITPDLTTASRLISIDVATMQATVLGRIEGIVATSTNGFTISPDGTRYLQQDNRVYRLGGAAGLDAQPFALPLGSNSTLFNGLGFDTVSNSLLVSGGGGVWRVNPDGSATPHSALGGSYRDIAFAVPAPGAAVALILLSLFRRRAGRA